MHTFDAILADGGVDETHSTFVVHRSRQTLRGLQKDGMAQLRHPNLEQCADFSYLTVLLSKF